MNPPDVATAVRSLLIAGFLLDAVDPNVGFDLIRVHRHDEFGASTNYAFMVARDRLTESQIEAARIAARHGGARLITIGALDAPSTEPNFLWDGFLGLLGGPVLSTGPLDPNFPSMLEKLGHNRLPDGMEGTPDDLLEAAVRESLQFLLGARVLRYGQERRFERRPDGIALPRRSFAALFDAKAYGRCFEVDADSVRRFQSYVREFEERYREYMPRLNAFIVVSGEFCQGEDSLRRHSQDFAAEGGVPLCFVTTGALGGMITHVCGFPTARHAVDWRIVFADPVRSETRLIEELEKVRRDGVIAE